MKRKWLVDFDSTLVNLEQGQVESVNKRFGTKYRASDIDNWDFWTTEGQEKEDYVWGDNVFLSRDWTMSLGPIKGAIDGVKYLQQEGWLPIIVSDRHPYMTEWLVAWLSKYQLYLPVVVSNRHSNPKTQVALDFGLTHVIEDAPHNSVNLSKEAHVDIVYLLDKPWNRGVEESSKLIRAKNWNDLVQKIDKHTQMEFPR